MSTVTHRHIVVDGSNVAIGDDIVLKNVHSEAECEGRTCWIHSPTEHLMRDWPMNMRVDRVPALLERLCPQHSCGHPDPDQRDYFRTWWSAELPKRAGGWASPEEIEEEVSAEFVHGCCGCCR